MLKTLKWFVIGLVAAAAFLGWFAYTHHVVKTNDGLRVVKKTRYTFQNIYVDVTSWGVMDYYQNSDVTKALAEDGWEEAKSSAQDRYDKAKEGVKKGIDDAKKKIGEMTK